MDTNDGNIQSVGEVFQSGNDSVIACVGVALRLADLLQSIYDNEVGVGVRFDEILDLFGETTAESARLCRLMKLGRNDVAYSSCALDQSRFGIFEIEVQNRALLGVMVEKLLALGDGKAEVKHEP